MVRVCDGKSLPKGDPSKVYLLRTFGNRAHEIWTSPIPEAPGSSPLVAASRHAQELVGMRHRHRLPRLGAPGLARARMTAGLRPERSGQAVLHPRLRPAGQQPGADRPVPTDLHGPISTGPKGNRVYFGYGTNAGGILQIVDREKLLNGPKEPTPENLRAPEIGRLDHVAAGRRAHGVPAADGDPPSSPSDQAAACATSS